MATFNIEIIIRTISDVTLLILLMGGICEEHQLDGVGWHQMQSFMKIGASVQNC
jgi:hypothetical protein